MKARRCWGILLVMLAGLAISSPARAVTLLESPYLSFADSPFNGVGFDYFHLEDLEDGQLNAVGASVNGGVVLGPGSLTDSVDGDDGVIDGFGNNGHSWYSMGIYPFFDFTFDEGTLGAFPTHAGVVCTDLGLAPSGEIGIGAIEFRAYGPGDVLLGVLTDPDFGDGTVDGGTAEDRFFGAIDAGGISRITITALTSLDWEVDHLQYGKAAVTPPPVPEAGSALLLVGGLGFLGFWGLLKRRG